MSLYYGPCPRCEGKNFTYGSIDFLDGTEGHWIHCPKCGYTTPNCPSEAASKEAWEKGTEYVPADFLKQVLERLDKLIELVDEQRKQQLRDRYVELS